MTYDKNTILCDKNMTHTKQKQRFTSFAILEQRNLRHECLEKCQYGFGSYLLIGFPSGSYYIKVFYLTPQTIHMPCSMVERSYLNAECKMCIVIM